jgi:SAM-dependent methyltransferase
MHSPTVDSHSPNAALASLRADLGIEEDPFRLPVSKRQLYLSAGRQFLRNLQNDLRSSPIRRDESYVTDSYERHWRKDNASAAAELDNRRVHLLVGNRLVYVNGWFIHRRYTQLILDAAVKVGAQSILEVGSGWGANLALMALRRPELRFTGLELTDSGIEGSRALMKDLPSQYLRAAGVTELDAQRRAALERVEFHQGNALQMPFADKSFDVSFTSLVLEQIPRDFGKALDEMRRVTRRYCIFNEAFAEANGWLTRAHLRRVDYFRSSKEEWRKHGLEPVYFTTQLPQKLTFRTGLLVARVVD